MVVNYRWVNENLDVQYEAVIGNGHAGAIAASTNAETEEGDLREAIGLGATWQGRMLTLTARIRRNPAGGQDPLLSVTVWQSDPNGVVPGRINEQVQNGSAAFDANGLATIDAVVTFD
jgi:hypothetical protein